MCRAMSTDRSSFFVAFLLLAALFACSACTPGSGQPDAGQAACPAQVGEGTVHSGVLASSETWTVEQGPHVVTADVTVEPGAVVTIEPCAAVRIAKNVSLIAKGQLLANGTADQPIHIGAIDSAAPWGSLKIDPNGFAALAYVNLTEGGSHVDSDAPHGMIEVDGDETKRVTPVLGVEHVTLTGSASFGLTLRGGVAFTVDSHDLTVTKSKKAPMRIWPRLVSSIPVGNYKDNTEDAIVVTTDPGGEINVENVTFHDRGVPYRIGDSALPSSLVVGPEHFTLTIEAGVVMTFQDKGALRAVSAASSTGVISAVGTADRPVVLTSASLEPVAGRWVGVRLGAVADPGFQFDFVQIRFAGGVSMEYANHCQPNPTLTGQVSKDDDAALAIFHQPPKPYLTNSLIEHSAADGVNNAYTGSYVDSKPTNIFKNVVGCQVTYPLPTMGVCPHMGCP